MRTFSFFLSTVLIWLVVAVLTFVYLGLIPVHAKTIEMRSCGIIAEFEGEVRLVNNEQDHLLDVKQFSEVPCDAWISTYKGWAQIRLLNGLWIHLGEFSFLQVGSPLTLYKGALYAYTLSPKLLEEMEQDASSEKHKASHASKEHEPEKKLAEAKTESEIKTEAKVQSEAKTEVKAQHEVKTEAKAEAKAEPSHQTEYQIETAPGRIKFKEGQFIVIVSQEEERTQLISLEKSATLANRFESSRAMNVNEGETSYIDFIITRVVPHAASAISLASLRPKFIELRIPQKLEDRAIVAIKEREKKSFIPPPDVEEEDDLDEGATLAKNNTQRSPAQVSGASDARPGAATGKNEMALPSEAKSYLKGDPRSDPRGDPKGEPKREIDQYRTMISEQVVDTKKMTGIDAQPFIDRQRQKLKKEEEEKDKLIQELRRVQE